MKLAGTEVVVGGFGVSGYAAVAALTRIGARVTLVDDRDDHPPQRVAALEELGARVRLGAGATAALPPSTDLVVISPGWPPRTPLLVEAAAQAVPVWGEVELGWGWWRPSGQAWLRVRRPERQTTPRRVGVSP
ncbi:MAG: UDP-N-acetylmuramoyl-L-alanine--D-glutamate ligase, partial [Nocardioidaceae bacterium]